MTYLHARIWAPRIPASISRMRRLPAIVLIAALAALAPATAGAADLFNNWNTGAVQNAPTGVTVFTLAAPAHITELVTYHWNNGHGLPALPPVTITLTGATGATFGPFTAVGSPGTQYPWPRPRPRAWPSTRAGGFRICGQVRMWIPRGPGGGSG